MKLIEMIRENIIDEIKGRDDYRKLANHLRKSGYYSEGNLVDSIADDEDRHANLLMDIINSIREKKGIVPRRGGMPGTAYTWELKEYYPEEYEAMRPERSGVIVSITDAGDTSWSIGDTIASEDFDLENSKMLSLGKRPALGMYHY